MPQDVRFTAEPADAGGEVEVISSRWLFRKQAVRHPLRGSNSFAKGFGDTNYEIYVTPEQDVTIAFETRHFSAKALYRVLGAVIALGVLVFWILRAI